jgi:SRSO17 transposase
VLDIANQLPSSAWRTITWRNGTRGPQRGRFAAVRIHTAHRHAQGNPPGDEQWLLCEWPSRAKQPTTFWLSNLPASTAKKRLVYLAKLRWRIERDYQEMKSQLGLDHFEGRTWSGFHHHAACVAAAHAFLALDRARFPPQPSTVSADLQTGPSAGPAEDDRPLSDVQ